MATGYKGIINKGILTKKCYSMYCEYCDVEFMIKVKSPPTRKSILVVDGLLRGAQDMHGHRNQKIV